MDKDTELQEFDLDDILNEFHDLPQEEAEEESQKDPRELPEDLLDGLLDLPEDPSEDPLEGLLDLPEDPSEDPLEGLLDLTEDPEQAETPEAPSDQPEEPDLTEDVTLRFDPEEEAPNGGEPAPEEALSSHTSDDIAEEDTKDIDQLIAEALAADEDEASAAPEFKEEDFTPPQPIDFNPRAKLRELKKKLVAGPEKRYYELSELGVGKLQVAILVNVLIVALCAGVTAMFALDMVPESRLRLVIFSQVLAMLLSTLLGCHQLLDGLGELFKGRFTINTLLVFTFAACCVDAVLCLSELRVPCCAAFCLEMTMALFARYHRRSTEMAQMDTMRKAVRLYGIAKASDYYEGRPGLLRTEGQVEDFMDTYSLPSAPEKVQSVYALLSLLICIGIAVFAGTLHGFSMAVQILSTSLLVAVPASFFIATTRPMAVLEKRLHMVGTVLCGWRGVKGLAGKAVFPLKDEDLFPQGSTKLNGVKFYGKRDSEEVVSYTASLIIAAGGGLVPVFRQLLKNKGCSEYPVQNFQNYGTGGIGGEVQGDPVLMGSLNFLQDMGVHIPEGTMVNQAVYAAIDGQLSAVYAISYAKMRSASAGLVTLTGYRKLITVILGGDFMLTESFLQSKFGVKTNRMAFPSREVRAELLRRQPDEDAPVLAIATRPDLVSAAYAVTGARALGIATRLAVAIHLLAGIVGILIMLALAYLGSTELLAPINVLLYQLIWMIPGVLVTEWTRAV